MPQDKSNALLRTQVGEPIPGKHALDDHDKPLPIRGHGFEKGFRSSFHIAVKQDFPIVVHEADIHGARMQINATVKGVLVGVESHEVFSSFMSDFCPRSAYHWDMRRGRPQSLSTGCSRRLPASAPTSLPLPGASEPQRWRQ